MTAGRSGTSPILWVVTVANSLLLLVVLFLNGRRDAIPWDQIDVFTPLLSPTTLTTTTTISTPLAVAPDGTNVDEALESERQLARGLQARLDRLEAQVDRVQAIAANASSSSSSSSLPLASETKLTNPTNAGPTNDGLNETRSCHNETNSIPNGDDTPQHSFSSSSSSSLPSSSMIQIPPLEYTRSPMCQVLPPIIPGTLYFWNSYLDRILHASRSNSDNLFAAHDFTAEILHLISPDKIDRGIVGVPHRWAVVQRVLTKAWRRYRFIVDKLERLQNDNNNDNSTTRGTARTRNNNRNHRDDKSTDPSLDAPPVKIVVMGGSVAVGTNCRKFMRDFKMGFHDPNRHCTWAHRLETFLNNILVEGASVRSDTNVVIVDKIALGGTNTEIGQAILENDLLPETARDADIIINAYSTNDMHAFTMESAKQQGTTLRDKIHSMVQDFTRTVMKDGDCGPLLLHVDDYLGNEQREILKTTELSQAVQSLSAFYGFPAVSYPNVVRDIVYGDTKEDWFSPSGWYDTKGNMLREIHPNMSMHMVMSWLISYGLLHTALTYCTVEPFFQQQKLLNDDHRFQVQYEPLLGLPSLLRDPKWKEIRLKPRAQPNGLPPKLEPSLSLENVTALWKAAPALPRVSNRNNNDCSNSVTQQRCSFSWMTIPDRDGNFATDLKDIFPNMVQKNNGWEINKENSKVGISPEQKPKPSLEEPRLLELLLRNVATPPTALTVFYLKSYGKKWEESQVRLTVQARTTTATTTNSNGTFVSAMEPQDLSGRHDKETSETYVLRVPLNQLTTSVDLVIGLELTGGEQFKLLGLAFC